MTNKEEYARLMRSSLEDNAHERNTYIKKALDTLSDADKASDKEVLDMTREIVNAMFRGEVGAKLAINIANGVRLQRVNEDKDNHSTSEGASSPFAIFHFIFLLLFLLHRSN